MAFLKARPEQRRHAIRHACRVAIAHAKLDSNLVDAGMAGLEKELDRDLRGRLKQLVANLDQECQRQGDNNVLAGVYYQQARAAAALMHGQAGDFDALRQALASLGNRKAFLLELKEILKP